MDILSTFNDLPEPVKSIIVSVAADFVKEILHESGRRVKKTFTPAPKEQALKRAMTKALAVTLQGLTDDPNEMEHLLGLLKEWIANEDVAGELELIIAPQPDAALDIDMLVKAFEALGYDPELFHEELSFEEIIERFVQAFYNAAAEEPELQEVIKIGLLRRLAEQTARQTELLQRNAESLKRIAPETHIDDIESRYLRRLYAKSNELPLAGKPPDAGGLQPRLQRVYVDLMTTERPELDAVLDRLHVPTAERARVKQALKASDANWPHARADEAAALSEFQRHEQKKAFENHPLAPWAGDEETLRKSFAPLSALEAIRYFGQVVILGDPGSGKSTLTKRIAGLLAAPYAPEADEESRNWQAQLGQAFDGWLFPLRIVLSRLAQTLPAEPSVDDLIAYAAKQVAVVGDAPGGRIKDRLLARMKAPPSIVFLLDGLDEVSDPDQRKRIRKLLTTFKEAYPDVPLIVTCRIRPYEEDKESKEDLAYLLPFRDVLLAPLDQNAQKLFVHRWHDELVWAGVYETEAAERAKRRLLDALKDDKRKELREMAGTPLLLTMMARVNYKHGLPNERAVLYERFVQQMLWEWDRLHQTEGGEFVSLEIMLEQEGIPKTSLERALSRLAYEIHGSQGSRDTVDIPKNRLRDALESSHPGSDDEKAAWAVRALKLIDHRAGLLRAMKQGEIYQFTHRTFQEYFAARWLASGPFIGKFEEKIDEEQWREAIFLALGYQISVQSQYDDALSVIKNLLPEAPRNEREWRRALLLGEAYVRLLGEQRASEAEGKKVAKEVKALVPDLLRQAMWKDDFSPSRRFEAGLLLDELGWLPDDLNAWVRIDPKKLPRQPREFRNVRPFYAMRYHITNVQFERFIAAGGYKDEINGWWSDEGLAWRMENHPDYRGEHPVTQPEYWNDITFGKERRGFPVVGVSYYEAEAFANWLTWLLAQVRAGEDVAAENKALVADLLDQKGCSLVRLPTRAEWVIMAGGLANKNRYPWDPPRGPATQTTEEVILRANTTESNINRTSPVAMYPQGRSQPFGLFDLAGNVWEWTDTPHERYPEVRLLCGGSWINNHSGARVANHIRSYRSDSFNYLGFRLVSPIEF